MVRKATRTAILVRQRSGRTQFEPIGTEVDATVPPRHDDHHVRDVLSVRSVHFRSADYNRRLGEELHPDRETDQEREQVR